MVGQEEDTTTSGRHWVWSLPDSASRQAVKQRFSLAETAPLQPFLKDMVFTIRKRAAENSLLLADGGEAVAVFRSDYCSLAVTLAPKTLILTKRGMIRSQLSAARLSPGWQLDCVQGSARSTACLCLLHCEGRQRGIFWWKHQLMCPVRRGPGLCSFRHR